MTRVLVVDDHELFRAGVRSELEDLVELVGDAATVDEAVREIDDKQPDVVPSSLTAIASFGTLWRGSNTEAVESNTYGFFETDLLYGDHFIFGSSGLAASANGRNRVPTRIHPRAKAVVSALIESPAPRPAIDRNRCGCAACAPAARARDPAPIRAAQAIEPCPPARLRAPDRYGETADQPRA